MESNKEIEIIEEKYLSKYFHFLKSIEDEILEGYYSKETIRNDWGHVQLVGHSDSDVGLERIVYFHFSGRFFGKPNSNPIGSDLLFETDDAFIHIDVKTVKASLTGKTNISDYNTDIFVGNNQTNYNGKIDVGGVEKEYKNAKLPTYYTINNNKKICLTYFLTFLYNEDNSRLLSISLINMPNGELVNIYKKLPLKAGKRQDGLTKEERKKYSETIRFNWSKTIEYKLLNNKKRVKIVYFDKNMDNQFKNKLKLIEKIYDNQDS